MSATMTCTPEGAASAFEENITLSSDSALPPNEGIFFKQKTRIENADILNGPELIKAGIRSDLYRVIHEMRAPVFKRNEILLTASIINNHDTDHQDRDAFIAMKIYEAFADKLDSTMLEPVLVASMIHDMQYIPAARQYADQQSKHLKRIQAGLVIDNLKDITIFGSLMNDRRKWKKFLQELDLLSSADPHTMEHLWTDGSYPEQIRKPQLDTHAELGEQHMRELYNDPIVGGFFAHWTHKQKEIAALSIRDHSNGTKYNPYTVPLEAKVLRLADKLDNSYLRVPEWMLSEKSQRDPVNCHRYVPTAIRSMDLDIDRATKTFTVIYAVDTEAVNTLMHREVQNFNYTNQQFIDDFERAYSKSMRIAAEVSSALFAEEDELYSTDAVFKVCLHFPDGSEEIRTYEPQPTAPAFS